MAWMTRALSPVGFGAFKIGRNVGAKYAQGYDLPDLAGVERLLNGVLDAGINFIDTAPAYGLSEERIGECLAHRREEFILSTKVGETFTDGVSRHDFSKGAVRRSVENSLRRLRTDVLDLVLIHSSHDDVNILENTDVVPTLVELRAAGLTRGIGLSGYTIEAFRKAMAWADALMLTYHPDDSTLAPVIAEAGERGIAVLVKKGLDSGSLSPAEALPWILRNPSVTSVVIGSLSLDHMKDNLRIALTARKTGR